jgi:hypothetical protein
MPSVTHRSMCTERHKEKATKPRHMLIGASAEIHISLNIYKFHHLSKHVIYITPPFKSFFLINLKTKFYITLNYSKIVFQFISKFFINFHICVCNTILEIIVNLAISYFDFY